jgi:hypothetical protein
VISPVARPLPTQDNTNTKEKRTGIHASSCQIALFNNYSILSDYLSLSRAMRTYVGELQSQVLWK